MSLGISYFNEFCKQFDSGFTEFDFSGLQECFRLQREFVAEHDDVQRFLKILQELLSSGRYIIADASSNRIFKLKEHAQVVGLNYEGKSGPEVYLIPNPAYNAIVSAAQHERHGFNLSRSALQKRLKQQGIVLTDSSGRLAKRPLQGGRKSEVWLLANPAVLKGGESDETSEQA